MSINSDSPDCLSDKAKDDTVLYRSDTLSPLRVLSKGQFEAITKSGNAIFISIAICLILIMISDGYWWTGRMNTGTALVGLVAMITVNALLIGRHLRRKQAICSSAPEMREKIYSPESSTSNRVRDILLDRLADVSDAKLWISLFFSAILFIGCLGMLAQLISGAQLYGGRGGRTPLGPILPVIIITCSGIAIAFIVRAIVSRIGRRRY